MAGKFWGTNYWKGSFWNDDFWAENAAVDSGRFWNANYFNSNFWNANYFINDETGTGDVTQGNSVNLPIQGYPTTAGQFLEVGANTATIPITAFNTTAGASFDTNAGFASLPIVAFAASVQTTGYQLGDIDLRFVPNSTIVVTNNVLAGTAAIPIAPMVHTIGEGGGINVACSVAAIPMSTFVTDTSFDIAVDASLATLPITSFNTTAGLGIQVNASVASLPINSGVQGIVATPNNLGIVTATTAALPITALPATVESYIEVVENEGDAYVQGYRPPDIAVGGGF